MTTNIWHECLRYAIYYAPRGRERLMRLGESMAQRYLASSDRLIGVLGEAGTGKSSIVRGMFPGLELTNEDESINNRPAPLVQMHREGKWQAQTFHVDARFESAFVQLYEIADALKGAVEAKRRVVVEHFELLYPLLGMNAELLIAVGEEIIISRPDVFGPYPDDLWTAIENTAIYRRMAHTAEDITSLILEEEYGFGRPDVYSEVSRGFVIEFPEKPGIDLAGLEKRVRDVIDAGLPVAQAGEHAIRIGERTHACAGPRIHVRNTAEIEEFRLVRSLSYEPLTGRYCLVGLVGEPRPGRYVSRHPADPAAETDGT